MRHKIQEGNVLRIVLCRSSRQKKKKKKNNLLTLYLKKFDYSLGATPIGNIGRAPDEDGYIGLTIRVNYRLHHQSDKHHIIKSTKFTPFGRYLRLVEENNPKILGIEMAKQGSRQNFDSQAASSRKNA
jgi:hypothetical protein